MITSGESNPLAAGRPLPAFTLALVAVVCVCASSLLAGCGDAAGGPQMTVQLGRAATPMELATRWGFRAFASLAVIFALLMITRREVVTAVVCLVASFFSLAGCYVFLHAQFLAVLQVLIYTGAVMVLFLFVIMLLNRTEPELGITRRWGTLIVGIAAASLIVGELFLVLWYGSPQKVPAVLDDFGSVQNVGAMLFAANGFLIPFEITSILLLTAVVGAVVVAHRTRHREMELKAHLRSQTSGTSGAGPTSAHGGH